jgi:type II secretory pathway pseudopilin PulG
MPPIHLRARRRQAGFTLIELTVSLIVIVEVLLAVLMLFDFSNKLSHAQSNIADMQQSLRIAQNEMNALVRTAGRGGLTFFNTAQGGALWVRNNVASGARIGDAFSPLIVPNTDVLTVRGVFSSPMYQVNYLDTTSLVYYTDLAFTNVTTDPNAAVYGKLKIMAQTSPDGQTLQTLFDIVAKGFHEAMIIESANNPDVHAVVELLPGQSSVNVATQAVLAFQVRGTASDKVTSYQTLIPGGGFPSTMKSVSEVGILEEYRFYIRQNYASTTDLASKLTKARFLPGMDTAWGPTPTPPGGVDYLSIDLADNILDLQVALAADSTNHIARSTLPAGTLPAGVTDSCTSTTITADPVNCYISEATNGVNDDWVYNGAGDDLTNAVWTNAQLYYVRLSLLARTDGRDKNYEAPLLSNIEDHAYTATDPLNLANTASGSTQQRMFRRRILQTVIDVRNL